MKLILKARPEDFLVRENAALPLVKKGEYSAYLLTKTGWNTVELLRQIARQSGVPFSAFAYAGRKDRYSQSFQYISVKSAKRLAVKEGKYSLSFLGFMDRPMGPDLILGNSFEVTVRKLSQTQAQAGAIRAEAVAKEGFPNYFDDQRFGSFDSRQGFLAHKVLKGEFNGALKIYLTSAGPQDPSEVRKRRQLFFEHWRDWKKCLSMAKTATERECFAYLADRPTDFIGILRKVPGQEMSVYFSAFQAYLWNEMLRQLILRETGAGARRCPGVAGDYLFNTGRNEFLENLWLPVPGSKPEFADEGLEALYHDVLAKQGIKQGMFNKQKARQAFFKSFLRRAVVKPELLIFDIAEDELYSGRKKMVFRFSLARGSFATMMVKSLFS